MNDNKEQDRKWAIERYLAKESPSSIYTSMGHSKSWFYKWMERYRTGEEFDRIQMFLDSNQHLKNGLENL